MDGRKLALPEDLAGVMLLNIQSYMGGVDLWAGGDAPAAAGPSTPQSVDDKKLEVVGVYGVLHLGQLQVRGRSGRASSLEAYRETSSMHLPQCGALATLPPVSVVVNKPESRAE